ncbi:MAG TPA: FtsX-like permease family protein [Polyangia bacterium]|nr:FtsX-like permease family protein [Polyangia bacterium]
MHPSDQTDQRVILEIVLRVVLSVVIVGLIAAFMYIPEMWLTYATRWTLLAIAVALGLGWVLFELLKLGLERLVGFRYLHRGRRTRWALVCLAGGLAVLALGFVVFMLVRRQHHHRILETAGVVCILVGGLLAMVGFLLRALSVFTTISTFGIVLGVASLIVVFGVTSGFEREFEDKVLALNAHLIVQAYGDADFAELEEIETKLRGLPGVVQMAPFLFSAGEVMIGRVGANLKGIDLQRGAEDLRRALERGSVEDLARPARCPLAGTKAGQTTTDVGRIAIGAEMARRLHVGVGDCVPIMVPFSSGATDAPVSYLFEVTGIFRMGFNEYDTRIGYTSIADAQRLASVRRLVSGVELRFADPMRALTVGEEVQRRLGSPHHLVDWRDLNGNLFKALQVQKVVILLHLVIIVIVAAFNIVSSLTMIVLSKMREVAILKSMGAPAGMVARIFLIGGTIVGLLGTGLGIGYGLLVCLLARLYGYPLDPKVYLIGELPVQIRPEELVGVALGTMLIAWVATIYPSLRASGMKPVEGLRYT